MHRNVSVSAFCCDVVIFTSKCPEMLFDMSCSSVWSSFVLDTRLVIKALWPLSGSRSAAMFEQDSLRLLKHDKSWAYYYKQVKLIAEHTLVACKIKNESEPLFIPTACQEFPVSRFRHTMDFPCLRFPELSTFSVHKWNAWQLANMFWILQSKTD